MYTKFENNPSLGIWFIALSPLRAAGGGRLWRKTITSPNPSDMGDIINGYHCTRLVAPIMAARATCPIACVYFNTKYFRWKKIKQLKIPYFWTKLFWCQLKTSSTSWDIQWSTNSALLNFIHQVEPCDNTLTNWYQAYQCKLSSMMLMI